MTEDSDENNFPASDQQQHDDTLIKLQCIHDSCDYHTTLDNVQMNNNFSIIHLNVDQ